MVSLGPLDLTDEYDSSCRGEEQARGQHACRNHWHWSDWQKRRSAARAGRPRCQTEFSRDHEGLERFVRDLGSRATTGTQPQVEGVGPVSAISAELFHMAHTGSWRNYSRTRMAEHSGTLVSLRRAPPASSTCACEAYISIGKYLAASVP